MVTGGYFSNTTEILKDKEWTVLENGNLPWMMHGFGLASINNNIFSFGEISFFSYHKTPQDKVHIKDLLTPGPFLKAHFFILLIFSGGYGEKGAISSILKFNIYEKPNWSKQSYDMSRPRYYFGISVVDFKYYSKACKYRE